MRRAEQHDAEYRERQSEPAHCRRYLHMCEIEERRERIEEGEHECREHHPVEDAVTCEMTCADTLHAAGLALVVQAHRIADNPGAAERDFECELSVEHGGSLLAGRSRPELTLVMRGSSIPCCAMHHPSSSTAERSPGSGRKARPGACPWSACVP